jgi:hypothetical protein
LRVATTLIVKREQQGNQTLDRVLQLHEIHKKYKMTIDDDEEDDGKNDGGVDDPFDDSKELVAVSVKAAEPTEVVGDKGGAFLMEAKQK